jgi:hypothetical protein
MLFLIWGRGAQSSIIQCDNGPIKVAHFKPKRKKEKTQNAPQLIN